MTYIKTNLHREIVIDSIITLHYFEYMKDFEFHLNKMGVSGALFDMVKLLDVAKGVISKFTAQEVYDFSYAWAERFDPELKEMLDNKEYSLKVLGIERGNVKPRKDIAKWSDVKDIIYYMYPEKFAKNTEFEYQKITDPEEIKTIVSEYVNNYFDIQTDGTIEYKGALDPKQYLKELKKGYDAPVVAIAVFEYLVNNVPVMTTLRNHKDILDFCKTQNVGRQFEVVYDIVENGKIKTIYSQRHIRFYVSTNGGYLDKVDTNTNNRSSLCAGHKVTILNSLDDTPISERNIDYTYYFREARKIIDPIKLGINPKQKGNARHKIKSGKQVIEQLTGMYNTLFDDLEED